MEVNGSLFNIIDHDVITSDPFVVNAETIRNCNRLEGPGQILGLLIEHEDVPTGTGFYVHLYDLFTNEDNRWPTYTWNRTDLSESPGICPIVPLDIETHGIAGRVVAPQNQSGVNPQ